MRMFLLGASGRTGNLVIERGLSRGHEITAVVRSALVEEPRDHLRIVVGNPSRLDDLAPNLADHDVVISSLGQRPT